MIPESAGAASDAARAINSFGVDLYRRVSAGSGNVVISPASVAIALDMARAGAQGETAVQMDAVLHATGSADAQATAVGSLDQALAALNGTFQDLMGNDLPVALRIANAPFAQIGMAIAPAYLDAVATRFGAPLRLGDYVRDPNAARLLINAWVKAQTEGRIPDLLAPPDVSTLTRLVLVNAIYLHAPWLLPFDPKLTAPGTFTRADASQVEVPMMTTHAFWPYAAGNGWKAVELPYLGGSLALDVILPDDLASFEAHLASTELTHITGALKPGPLEFTLPCFHIQTEVRLADALKTLGMPLAFDQRRADFSGIALPPCTDTPNCLFISQVIHQANIDVDEKGTTAAAATAVVMGTGGPGYQGPWITVRLDRPFLFVLRDTKTAATLFMGRVADPSTKG